MKRSILVLFCAFVAVTVISAQDKPDALKLFRNGRDLEAAGRVDDAKSSYSQSIDVCKRDLAENPKNMDAYSIYGWSLVRLGKYQESVDISLEAIKVNPDYRIMETIAEGYFYLSKYSEALKYMEKYIDAAPSGERISTAYFFEGEIYRMNKQSNRADIAYSTAVYLEPSVSLWWFRLGSVRESLGDKKGALDAYQHALKLRPDYKDATDGLNRVRT